MKPIQYLKHSTFYFVKLVLLLALLYGLLSVTGYASVSAQSFLTVMLHTKQGVMLLCVIVLWTALYPMIGFVRRTVDADITKDRDAIVGAFGRSNYALASEEPDGKMTFRASSLIKRIWNAFGDKITVTADGNRILLTGIRKEVVQAAFRIETAVRHKTN